MSDELDIFDSLLTLEESSYEQGYQKGLEDGKLVGTIEGRALGLSNGFSKQLQLGRLRGRALVWQARLQASPAQDKKNSPQQAGQIAPIDAGKRLDRQVASLLVLTDPKTLDVQNEEVALDTCEQKLKRATAKARLIGRTLGGALEESVTEDMPGEAYTVEAKLENIEDVDLRGARR